MRHICPKRELRLCPLPPVSHSVLVLKALLLENIHPFATEILTSSGFDVTHARGALDEAELAEALDGVQLLGIRSKTQITESVIAAAPDLLAIGAFCIGTNQIDLNAAASAGVAAFNAPFSNTRSVVELALAEIIALTRRMTERDRSLHNGVWDKSAAGAHEIRGRTIGIVGYGNIGSQLSVVAEAVGLRVVFFDTAEKLALGNAQRAATLDELLEVADVVTLHVDGRPGNAGFFGDAQFTKMKPGSIFLNLSRGFVVDVSSLKANIESGHIAGAGIDVFPTEPKSQGDAFESDLRALPNVILTPHIGGSTEEAQESIGRFVAGKLRDYISTGSTALSVNMPNLMLEKAPAPGSHRLAYLHRNEPGVLAEINQRLAARGANIEAQLLGTRGEIGYVLSDVGNGADPSVLGDLRDMESTIRLRVVS